MAELPDSVLLHIVTRLEPRANSDAVYSEVCKAVGPSPRLKIPAAWRYRFPRMVTQLCKLEDRGLLGSYTHDLDPNKLRYYYLKRRRGTFKGKL
jgi:hypothetical protein